MAVPRSPSALPDLAGGAVGAEPGAGEALLLTGPAGSGKSHAALGWIRQAATQAGPRGGQMRADGAALLLLPTYAQVTRARRLALTRWGARAVLDAPFATFTGVGERFLHGFEVRALPSAVERDRLMEEALRAAGVAAFERVRDRAGFRTRLLRLVKELKQSGAPLDAALAGLCAGVGSLAGVARRRLDGFLAVATRYDALLKAARLCDHEDALRELAERLEADEPARRPALLVVDGFDDFTPVEERILLALAARVREAGGAVAVTLPFDPARPLLFAQGAPVRARLLAAGFRERRLGGFARSEDPALGALAARLFAPLDPQPAPPPSESPAVRGLAAGDGPDQADRVAREVRAWVEGGPAGAARAWRDVLVVARHLGDVAPGLEAAFERLGIPLRTVGWAPTLLATPAARALEGPLEVLAGRRGAGRFRAEGLLEWLRWWAHAGPDPALGAAARAYERAQRERGYAPDFEAFVAGAPEPLAAPLARLDAEARALAGAGGAPAIQRRLRAALARLLPLPAPGGLDPDGRPRDPARDARRARAARVRAALDALLEGLGAAAVRTGVGAAATPAEAVDELRVALGRTPEPRPDPRLDAVALVDAEEARFWEAAFVVVVGVEEGRFPLRPREDLLLRDGDRRRLAEAPGGVRLPLVAEQEARERRLFYGALTRAREALLLVRSAYDEAGRPRPASPFLREVGRVVTPQPVAPAGAAPGRAAGHVDLALGECFSPVDLRLWAASTLRPRPVGAPAPGASDAALARALLARLAPDLARRARADRRREVAPIGPGDAARLGASLARRLARLTVSQVEVAVRCPMRFWIEAWLGLRASDLPLRGPEVDARTEGRALHAAFERALRAPGESAEAIAAAVVGPAGLPAEHAARVEREVARAVTLLRAREAALEGPYRPRLDALEFAFGDPEPLLLGTADGRFGLVGRLDRLDTAGGRALVVDYKRSASTTAEAARAERAGPGLQLRLYALAVERLLGVEVVGLEWVAQRERARRLLGSAAAGPGLAARREGPAPVLLEAGEFRGHLEAAEQHAAAAVAELRRVAPARRPHAPKECRRCEARAVCRPDEGWLRAQAGAGPAAEDEEEA